MPTISFFYGIYIMMNLRNKEHNPHTFMLFMEKMLRHFIYLMARFTRATSLARQRKWLKNSFLVIKKNY